MQSTDADMTALLQALLLPFVMGLIYAVVVFIVARKRNINPWGWTLATAIPVAGLIVAAVFFLTTLLSMLDRLNKLEQRETF